MRYKIIKRGIRDFLARLMLRIFTVTVFFIPLSFLRGLGIVIGKGFYFLSRRYRKLAASNMEIVFPEKEENIQRKIIKNSFVLIGENGSDSLWFITRSNKRRKSFIRIVGREFLDAALDKGKGVIAVTAHIGAFTILGGALASYDYRVNYILRTPRDEKMSNVLGRGLRMQNVKPIFTYPAIRCVNESISALRHNEILIILIDQDIGNSGIFINFFGRPASTPIGPIIFSLRTGAGILPMFTMRQNGLHKLMIQPEFKLVYEETAEQTVMRNTQRLTKLIETVIRAYPQQWSWVDRRWKTQMKPKLTERSERKFVG